MPENAEQRAVEEQFARIASELKQIKVVLVLLLIVSPVGLHLLGNLTGLITALGVVGFWLAVAIGAGVIVLLCVARLTGLHKALELKQDELTRILREHAQHEDGTPV